MRKIFFLILVLLTAFCQSSVAAKDDRVTTFIPPKDWKHNVEYQQIIDSPGVKSSALLAKAKEWCAKTFISIQNNQPSEDAAAGAVTCKGSVKAEWRKGSVKDEQTVWFKVTVETIDGRTRVTFSEFVLDHSLPNPRDKKSPEQKMVPMEKCFDEEGFPENNATERFLLNVHDQLKDLLESAQKALEK
jgi:hypothetical protein